MIKFERTCEYGGAKITFEVCDDDAFWPDVADEFYRFLLASGFVLDRQDLSNHFAEEP